MKKNILILGGYGLAGKQIAVLLLRQKPDLNIVLAGRNLQKAEKEAERINTALATHNVSALQLDASDKAALKKAFKESDFIINAASAIDHTSIVVEAVLESGNDYIDTQLSSPNKLDVLYRNAEQFKEKDICFVTDGGFHPGLPAALIRYSALQMDEIQKGNVFVALKIKLAETGASKSAALEFVDELKHYSTLVYKEGAWKKQSFSKPYQFDFRESLGVANCLPMFMEEMKILVEQLPNIKETGFYMAGFNKILDNWLMPIIFMGIQIVPKKWAWPFVNLFLWGSKFTKPPYGVKLVSECSGIKDKQEVNIRIEIVNSDEYLLTAAPVVACLLQILDGSIRKPGLWFQSNLVEPSRLLEDMEKMGVEYVVYQKDELLVA
ncbi:MAG: saccharopine dehydrogenase NADP-binding domain-containing protein [Bacteroidota bacterium]